MNKNNQSKVVIAPPGQITKIRETIDRSGNTIIKRVEEPKSKKE